MLNNIISLPLSDNGTWSGDDGSRDMTNLFFLQNWHVIRKLAVPLDPGISISSLEVKYISSLWVY